jgi:hypothetical protein
LPKFLRYSDNGYSQNAYSHNGYSHNGYSHSAAYTAGFNRGAEAQWLVNMRTRWGLRLCRLATDKRPDRHFR